MSFSRDGAIAALTAQFGDDHATSWPATWTLRLGMGDPRDVDDPTTIECNSTDHPGYATADVANTSTNFPDPDPDTALMTSADLALCTATGDWDDVPTHVWFTASTDPDTILDVFTVDFGEFTDGTPTTGDPLTTVIEKTYPYAVG